MRSRSGLNIKNTSRVNSHQSVPAELLFGNSITLDRGVLLPTAVISDNRTSLSTWAADMLRKRGELLKTAETAQTSKDQLHMTVDDPRRTTYEVREYALVEYQLSALVKGIAPNKLFLTYGILLGFKADKGADIGLRA